MVPFEEGHSAATTTTVIVLSGEEGIEEGLSIRRRGARCACISTMIIVMGIGMAVTSTCRGGCGH